MPRIVAILHAGKCRSISKLRAYPFRRIFIVSLAISLLLSLCLIIFADSGETPDDAKSSAVQSGETSFIKWVDFNISYEMLDKAVSLDISSQGSDVELSCAVLLACAAVQTGSLTSKSTAVLDKIAARLTNGENPVELSGSKKYYDYYYEAYDAVLSGLVGFYREESAEGASAVKYGVRAFSPIASDFWYSHYDDFGNGRSYGYARRHLGNDIMGSIGTPVIAVEGGIVEALGWNQYGGWRIGIRSHDGRRYYYYAHLRKDFPFRSGLKAGDTVEAGDVIGYLGRTGYSLTENVNNITTPHLHFGMQLIFDESQKDGNGEIWIDVYNIVKLLYRHRSEVRYLEESGDYERVNGFSPL